MLKLKILIAGISLFLMALLVISSLQPAGAVIIIETELPRVPSEMPILKTMPQVTTEEQALDIATRIFAVHGGVQYIDNGWMIADSSQEVWIYKSGSIKYFDNPKMWDSVYMYLPQEFPLEPESIAIAEVFLAKLRTEDLVSKSLHMFLEDVVADTTVIAQKENENDNTYTTTTFWNNVHVNFALSYDNIRLWGPGAKVRVYLGKEGEIIGFLGNFLEVKPFKMVHILTPEQAIENLRDVGYGESMPKNMVSKAVIKSIELVYSVPSPGAEVTYLVPVYDIKGTLTGEDGVVVDFVQTVLAVPQNELVFGE
jgi:alpha-galactosidase